MCVVRRCMCVCCARVYVCVVRECMCVLCMSVCVLCVSVCVHMFVCTHGVCWIGLSTWERNLSYNEHLNGVNVVMVL